MALFPDNLAGVADPDRLLQLTLEHFSADTGTIHVLASDGLLHLRAAGGGLPPEVRQVIQVIPVGKGIAGLAVERKEPVNLCNLQADASGVARPGARTIGVKGSICVPMMVHGVAVGALGIATYRERDFTEQEIALLLEAGRRIGAQLWNS